MASQTDIDISSLAAADRRLPVLTAGVVVALVIALVALAAGTLWRTAEFSSLLGLISAVATLISGALAATRIIDGGRSRLAEALLVRSQAASICASAVRPAGWPGSRPGARRP
jgi:hypothetical protein